MNNVKVLFFLYIFLLQEKQIYSYEDHYNRIKNSFSIKQTFSLNNTKENKKNNKRNKKKIKSPVGSPHYTYIENIYEYKNFKFGYSLLKKPGESLLKINPNKTIFLFNSNNEFFIIENVAFIKRIIIGDFCIGFGQGLVFNNVFFSKKPAEQIKVIKIQRGIKKTNSHLTNKIKGCAGTFILNKNITTTFFISKNLIDGRLYNKKITSACRRLTYNTTQNISKKNAIEESIKGFNILLNTKDDYIEIGFNFVKTTFNHPFQTQKKMSPLFQGDKNINYSYFFRYLLGPIHFFLEHAFSTTKETAFTKNFGQGNALICGLIANTIKNIDIAICYRKYTPNYYNFYGKSFCICNSANSSQLKGAGKNEVGFYFCTLIKIYHNLTLTYSYDTYKNPWQAYTYKNKAGQEHLLTLKYYQGGKYFLSSIKASTQIINTQQKTKKNRNFYIKEELSFTHDSNRKISIQIHLSFERISKISAGIYSGITIPFKKNKISFFLLLCKITENKKLYMRKQKGYKEQGSTTINADVLTIGFSLIIKLTRSFLLNFFLEYNYKKGNNMPIIKISLHRQS